MADDLDAYLAALPDALTGELSAALREQAEALSEAQRRALQSQLQPPEETGELEASLVVVPGAHPLEFFVQAGGEETIGDIREGSSKPFDYALAMEFGSEHQPARPFFYPPYRAMRDDMQTAIDEAAKDALT